MAGNTDGSPRRVADPRKRLNAQDFWNAAFRGLSPGGLQQDPPPANDMGDVPPFSEDIENVDLPDPPQALQQNIVPIPVVLVDDLSHTAKRVEKFFITHTENITAAPSLVVPRNPFRTQVILTNPATGIIYLGHNESVLAGPTAANPTGFVLLGSSVVVLATTREIWAVGGTPPQFLSIVEEYDKDTAKD